MFVGAGIWCIPSNRGGRLDTVSLYWISLFLWFDYATSPTKRYRPRTRNTDLTKYSGDLVELADHVDIQRMPPVDEPFHIGHAASATPRAAKIYRAGLSVGTNSPSITSSVSFSDSVDPSIAFEL